jgi:hypothetical protein
MYIARTTVASHDATSDNAQAETSKVLFFRMKWRASVNKRVALGTVSGKVLFVRQ